MGDLSAQAYRAQIHTQCALIEFPEEMIMNMVSSPTNFSLRRFMRHKIVHTHNQFRILGCHYNSEEYHSKSPAHKQWTHFPCSVIPLLHFP